MLAIVTAAALLVSSVESPPPLLQATPVDLSTSAGRKGGAVLGTAVGTIVTLASSLAVLFAFHGGGGDLDGLSRGILAGALCDLAGALFIVPLGAWLGHQLAGGQGTYGAAVGGAAAGLAAGAALMGIGVATLVADTPPAAAVLIGLGCVVALAGPIVGLEASHGAATSPLVPTVQLAPRKKGAALVASWVL